MTQIFSQALWTIVFGLSLLFVGGLTLWTYGTQASESVLNESQHQTQRLALIYGCLASITGVFLLATSALLAM